MVTTMKTAKKFLVGMVVAALCATAFAPSAFASQTYYYPTYQTSGHNSAQIQALLNQLYTLIAQLQQMQGSVSTYTYTPIKTHTYGQSYYGSYDVEVETVDFDVESDDTVTLTGEAELDDAPYAHVWFEYGEGGNITEESGSIKLTNDDEFDIEVDDLDEDERYYFRAVAEDPSGYRVYGDLMGFGTDENDDDDDDDSDDNDEDRPEAETQDAENIEEDSAELHGEVSMNDFEDGLVFLVYGEDEDLVEEVEDENTYGDIDEEGDDLQKVQVDSSLDDTRTYWTTVFNLNDDTDYYFRICVEYEDEDGDETLECGSVENFQTEN
jgi:hypothetical protein